MAAKPSPTHVSTSTSQERDSIREFVATLDDNPDWSHFEYTPSVMKLIKVGLPAVPDLLDAMLVESEVTRLHAYTALSRILASTCGFSDQGWSTPTSQSEWEGLLNRLGNLDPSDTYERRKASVRLWREWISTAVAAN